MRKYSFIVVFALVIALLLAACGTDAPAAPAAQTDAAAPAADAAAPAAEATAPAAEEAAPAADAAAPAAEGSMDGKVVIAPGQPIRIGGSFGLTGPIPDPGKDEMQSVQIAIEDINAAGGIQGFMLELVAEDGACSGDQGTVVANKFAADGTIVAVSGGMCSGETFGLIPILKEARIPFVSPSATNPDVTSPDCDICNRVALSDALQGQTDATYALEQLGVTTAAVMHDNSDYGKGLAETFQAAFVAGGGEVTSFEGVQVGDTDFRAALAKVGANQPAMIFFGGYATEAGLIATQMKESAGLETAYFMSDDGTYMQQYLDAAGNAAEGTFASSFAGTEESNRNEDFVTKYVEQFGMQPSDLGPFHYQSYDTILMISDAINKVAQVDGDGNLVIDREALIKAIRATAGLQGLTGEITCDEIGNCGAGGIQIFQVKDGAFEQVSGYGLD